MSSCILSSFPPSFLCSFQSPQRNGGSSGHSGMSSMQLSSNSRFITTNFMAFDVFSSVKGGGLLDDMVARWYQELQERGESSLVPWKTIEAYFDSIPLVCAPTKDSVANQFARYVKVMDQLKTIIRSAVYLTFSDEERTPYFVAHRQLKANFEVPDPPPPSRVLTCRVCLQSTFMFLPPYPFQILQRKYDRVVLDHPHIPSDPMMRSLPSDTQARTYIHS
jgi:hypothetical protein